MADLDIVRTTLADTNSLTRDFPTPTGPLGYGTDLSLATDLTDTMDTVDPFSTRAIAEAAIRRLSTPRGALLGDPDYGIDVRAYCNRGVTDEDLRTLAARIRAELEEDDRVDAAAVVVTPSADTTSLTISIRITPFDARLTTFSLTLAVTSADVLIQELAAA